ncbi:MAG: Coenzyme F420 hydrogenase/dehydrogenase, beta subunit C-terminal domain [Candidatus Hydrothermarchaeales archaeon]
MYLPYLEEAVWDPKRCSGCGACVGTCPAKILDFKDREEPESVDSCQFLGNCYNVCPRTMTQDIAAGIGKRFGEDGGPIGGYKARYFARSSDNDLIKNSQNYGVATSILNQLLEESIVDSCLVVVADENYNASTAIARNLDDLKQTSRSKYLWYPVLKNLQDYLLDDSIKSLAVVGVPCVVQAVRRIQDSSLVDIEKAKEKIKFVLGLFCFEIFKKELLTEYLAKEKGISPEKIKKMNVGGKFLDINLNDGEKVRIDIKETKPYVRKGCSHCRDFTAEWANISVGNVGSPKDYGVVITRTELGERLFQNMIEKKVVDTAEFSPDTFAIAEKLSGFKKKRLSHTIE